MALLGEHKHLTHRLHNFCHPKTVKNIRWMLQKALFFPKLANYGEDADFLIELMRIIKDQQQTGYVPISAV